MVFEEYPYEVIRGISRVMVERIVTPTASTREAMLSVPSPPSSPAIGMPTWPF